MNFFLYSRNIRCSLLAQVQSSLFRHSNFKSDIWRHHISFIPKRHISWYGFYQSLSESAPVIAFQTTLIDIHQHFELPWWSVIVLTTLGIRTFIVFPLAVHQHQVVARLVNLNKELKQMAPELNKEVNIAKRMYGWDEDTCKRVFKKNMRDYYRKFVIRDNCHPFKTVLLTLIQIPVWICFSVAVRNLTFLSTLPEAYTESNILKFKTEGILWFTDLTAPDKVFIPVLLAAMNLILIEVHALRQISKSGLWEKVLLNTMRLTSVIIAFAAVINPSAVSFYWLCSSTFGLGQNLLLMSPKIRRFLRIPHTENESATPYRNIIVNFKNRFAK